MTQTKQRSAIFKFFYIILSIITFPIFAIIFILRHPIWFLSIILLILGGLIYYPLSLGTDFNNIKKFYEDKYFNLKLDLVNKASESGNSAFVPEFITKEVETVQQQLEEEKKESLREKGENYNDKIKRDSDFEEIATNLKQKKKGFKKMRQSLDSNESIKAVVEEGTNSSTGISALVKEAKQLHKEKTDETNDLNSLTSELDEKANNLETENKEETEEPAETVEAIIEEATEKETETEPSVESSSKTIELTSTESTSKEPATENEPQPTTEETTSEETVELTSEEPAETVEAIIEEATEKETETEPSVESSSKTIEQPQPNQLPKNL